MSDTPCGHPHDGHRLFCATCGKVVDLAALRTVKLPGFVGVRHSTSPAIDRFWSTGDPSVFETPKGP